MPRLVSTYTFCFFYSDCRVEWCWFYTRRRGLFSRVAALFYFLQQWEMCSHNIILHVYAFFYTRMKVWYYNNYVFYWKSLLDKSEKHQRHRVTRRMTAMNVKNWIIGKISIILILEYLLFDLHTLIIYLINRKVSYKLRFEVQLLIVKPFLLKQLFRQRTRNIIGDFYAKFKSS